MENKTVYLTDMMAFTLISKICRRISVLGPVLVRVHEFLSTNTSTSAINNTLELMGTNKIWVPEIQYSSTASAGTEYGYTSPVWLQGRFS